MGEGKWKAYRPAPGNGTTRAVYQCNAHVDCGKLLMAYKKGDTFCIMEKGEHTEEEQLKKRKNSPLSYTQEAAVKFSLDGGGRPAGMRVAMTKSKVEELQKEGMDPMAHKRKEGGMQGELPPRSEHLLH